MKIRLVSIFLLCLMLAALLSGCGGKGSSTSGGGGGSVGRSRIILTDDLNTGFSHVWVSIKKVELVSVINGATTLAFSNPAGTQVDLRTLRDATGARFLFLQAGDLQIGTYSGLRVTVDKNVVVFPTGATVGTQATFQGSGATDFIMELSFPFARPLSTLGADFVIDFDLSRWSLSGSVVSATGLTFILQGNATASTDTSRYETGRLSGSITSLGGISPNQTFTLVGSSQSIVVVTSASTKIFSNDGTVSPILANGVTAEVQGVFNASANTILASSIKLRLDPAEGAQGASATVTSIAGSTVTVNIDKARGFLPTSQYTFSTSSGGVFFGTRGDVIPGAQFLALLSVGSGVDLEGTVSGSSFNISKAKLQNGMDDTTIKGQSSQVNAFDGTIVVSASEITNAPITIGTMVKVTTSDSTAFKINGIVMTRLAFFNNFGNGQLVRVEGVYDVTTNTLTAFDVRVDAVN